MDEQDFYNCYCRFIRAYFRKSVILELKYRGRKLIRKPGKISKML